LNFKFGVIESLLGPGSYSFSGRVIFEGKPEQEGFGFARVRIGEPAEEEPKGIDSDLHNRLEAR